jgi:hypothetical protein
MDRVQEIFNQGTGTIRNGESHGAVGHAETVWAHFLSHNERRWTDLGDELVRRRLRCYGLSGEGLKGDAAGVLAGGREFPVEV